MMIKVYQREIISFRYIFRVPIFVQVIGTLKADWLKQVIDKALKNRNSKLEEETKGEFIVVSGHILKDLKSAPLLSSKIRNKA